MSAMFQSPAPCVCGSQDLHNTKTKDVCDHVKRGKDKLGLGDRVYECSECGLVLDRDHNAALNILRAGMALRRGRSIDLPLKRAAA